MPVMPSVLLSRKVLVQKFFSHSLLKPWRFKPGLFKPGLFKAGLFKLSLSSGLLVVVLSSCTITQPPSLVDMTIHQQWQLQPGDRIAGYAVNSGLGDIVVELSGQKIYAPVSGQVQWLKSAHHSRDCALFSSPEIPAYRLRLCGLKRVRLGDRQQGQVIGTGEYVALSMLRKQNDGSWAIVEPAVKMLEQLFLPN